MAKYRIYARVVDYYYIDVEAKDKDEAINNQSLLFQEMTVRFQHILENTANKLQERVKTGN